MPWSGVLCHSLLSGFVSGFLSLSGSGDLMLYAFLLHDLVETSKLLSFYYLYSLPSVQNMIGIAVAGAIEE